MMLADQVTMTAATQQKYLNSIQKLVAQAAQIVDCHISDRAAVDNAKQFGTEVWHLLHVFHHELPAEALQAADAQVIQLFTENEAEGERPIGRFWITNTLDNEPTDPVERRVGIDIQALRNAMKWLEVIAAKLQIGTEQPNAPTPQPATPRPKKHSVLLATIKDKACALWDGGFSPEDICKRMDEDRVPRPPGAVTWRHLLWSAAFKEHKGAVKKWICTTVKQRR
jgi:hypothetical protein